MKNLKVNDVVGYLTLLERVYIRGRGSRGKYSWICRCVCGTRVIRRSDLFEENKTMSCGCQHPTKNSTGEKSPLWKGCGRLCGQFFSVIKHGAIRRAIPFHLTIEQCWQLFVEQNGKCAITGFPLSLHTLRERRRGFEQTASLDRIDSKKPYTIDNVWWVHKDVNMMKKEYSLERFLEIALAAVKNNGCLD